MVDKPPDEKTRTPTDGFGTRAIHAGQEGDPETGALMTPIYANSTYEQVSPGNFKGGFKYSRTGNPTRADLEENIAALEGGAYGRVFASGMGAIVNVIHLLESGDHVLVGHDVYGGTRRTFTGVYEDFGIDFTFVDTTNTAEIADNVRDETALFWLETPTNPLMEVVDIQAAAEIANENDALVAVDNTFATPYLQRPLEHGADIVVHSLTKYMGGHSDVIAGAVITDDEALDERIGYYQNAIGATASPFECFLVLRGTKTLEVRMQRHCENAKEIASWLQDRPEVSRVYYPGLESHPQHDLAATQMDDFGGMLSFELDASLSEAANVASNTEVFTLAESLGGVESLIEQSAKMTHAAVPREERIDAGLKDGLIRLSVGIEDVEDLKRDLAQAIEHSTR